MDLESVSYVDAIHAWAVGKGGIILHSNTVSSIDPQSEIVLERFELSQNYPNPFNPATLINYRLLITTDVELIIYNPLGQTN